MNTFIFTNNAEKKFLSLPKKIQERIIKKLKDLKSHDDLLSVLKRLHHLEPATHRLRVGNYRLILEIKGQDKDIFTFWILDLGDRKDVYK